MVLAALIDPNDRNLIVGWGKESDWEKAIDPHGLKAVILFSSLKIRFIHGLKAVVFSLGMKLEFL